MMAGSVVEIAGFRTGSPPEGTNDRVTPSVGANRRVEFIRPGRRSIGDPVRSKVSFVSIGTSCDVCVVGGGPAGATVAARLSRLGYRVLVAEAGTSPRARAGESLSQGILPLLDDLEVRRDFEEVRLPRMDAIIHWADVTRRSPADANGLQVDRNWLDQLLLRGARQHGAQILESARVIGHVHVAHQQWCIYVRTPQGLVSVDCRFVVDAAGSRGFLAGGRTRLSQPTLALWAVWRNVPFSEAATRLEASRDHWSWGMPLSNDQVQAMLFLDPGACGRAPDLQEVYHARLRESRLLRLCVKGQQITPIAARSVAVSVADEPVGEDWIKVGESGLILDPLSSQGVVVAMTSGFQAAAAVNTLLRHPECSAAAMSFYRERLRAAAENNLYTAASFYAEQARTCPTDFWLFRASARRARVIPSPPPWKSETRVCCSPDLRFEPTPVLVGDRIDTQLAAVHPSLSKPVNWLAGMRLLDLVDDLDGSQNAASIVRSWDAGISSHGRGTQIMNWLWNHGLVTAVNEC